MTYFLLKICYHNGSKESNFLEGVELKKTKLFTFAMFIVGGVLGLLLALGIAEIFHVTASDKFCGTFCHSMEPMRDAYMDDLHGGKNRVGVKAECVACHLPHENVTKYVVRKALNGISEFTTTAFGNPDKINWEAKRQNKKDFVYDSGCMTCHADLQKATSSNMKSFLPHREYFSGMSEKTCVECHEHVGHKNLGFHLQKVGESTK